MSWSIVLHIWTLFYLIALFRNLSSEDTPEGFAEDEPEALQIVWWQVFGPIMAIAILNIGGIAAALL
jgi:hypothetical protein